MESNQPGINSGPITARNDSNVIIPLEEFSVDLEHNLGRANGNCYHRKPGVPNIHDGQIMVRLKKKRFIVLDYSIIPTPRDQTCAAVTPHIKCPVGSGEQICNASNCTKIGVPVCLFDSHPEEPVSLYLRSGLCFTCQRLLNEKRRTQRKRKGDSNRSSSDGGGTQCPSQRRFRMSGEILDLNPDAIIVNGPIEGTKHHGHGYEYTEIMPDIKKYLNYAAQETDHLALSMAPLSQPPPVNSQEHANIESLYNNTFLTVSKSIFLLSQWKSSFDAAINAAVVAEKATEEALISAAAVAAAQAAEAVPETNDSTHGDDQASSNMIPLLLAAETKDDITGDSKIKIQDDTQVVNNVEV